MALEIKGVESLTKALNLELPPAATMDDYLDIIIPMIRHWSEDLYEEEHYVNTRWKEIRDNDHFQESVLHILVPGGEYIHSIDGNIIKGLWRYLRESNTLILEVAGKSELYDLAFMNHDYFILSKHGDQQRKGQRKYFVLGKENVVANWQWRDVMEGLFNLYRYNRSYMLIAFIAIVVVAAILVYSFI
jgi:hypothetical protein